MKYQIKISELTPKEGSDYDKEKEVYYQSLEMDLSQLTQIILFINGGQNK